MGIATISVIILATLVACIDQASGAASVDLLDVVLSLKNEVTELTRKNEEQDGKLAHQERRMIQLDNKIAQQDTRIAHQERRLAQQDSEIAQHDKTISRQENEISFLKRKCVEKENNLSILTKNSVKHELVITELKKKTNEQKDDIAELKENAVEQEKETTELRKAIQAQTDNHHIGERQVPERVAFSLYLSHNQDHTGVGQKIKFDAVLLNEGNGYNAHIGVFTAPTKGLYLFAYSVGRWRVGQTNVRLMNNGNVINSAVVDVHTDHDDHQSGNVALVELDVGDVVFIEEHYLGDAAIYGSTADRWTTFSGVLLL